MHGGMVPAQPARRRPFGVKVIIALQTVTIFVLLLGFIAWWYSPDLQAELRATYGPAVDAVMPFVVLALTGVQLVTLTGFIRLKRWGWYLVIVLAGVSLATNLWRYFAGMPDYLTMVTNVLTVLYLNQREVQQAFRQPPGQEVQR
jgi:hypothetical protein